MQISYFDINRVWLQKLSSFSVSGPCSAWPCICFWVPVSQLLYQGTASTARAGSDGVYMGKHSLFPPLSHSEFSHSLLQEEQISLPSLQQSPWKSRVRLFLQHLFLSLLGTRLCKESKPSCKGKPGEKVPSRLWSRIHAEESLRNWFQIRSDPTGFDGCASTSCHCTSPKCIQMCHHHPPAHWGQRYETFHPYRAPQHQEELGRGVLT